MRSAGARARGDLRAPSEPAKRCRHHAAQPLAGLGCVLAPPPRLVSPRLLQPRSDGGVDVAEKRRELGSELVERLSGHDGYGLRSALAALTA